MKALVAAVLAALAWPAQDDQVLFAFSPQEGDRFTTHRTVTQTMSYESEGRTMEISTRAVQTVVREFLKVEKGVATRTLLHFKEDHSEVRRSGVKGVSRRDGPLRKRQVTVVLKDGKVEYEGGEKLDDEAREDLTPLTSGVELFPRAPVAPGDSWKQDGEAMKEDWGARDMKVGWVFMTFKELQKINDRSCAIVEADFNFLEADGLGDEHDFTMKAKYSFRVDRGYTESVSGKGEIRMKIMIEDGAAVTGRGTIEIEEFTLFEDD